MTYFIVQCSDLAKQKIKPNAVDEIGVILNTHVLTKYPFDMLQIGEAFATPINKEFSLRQIAVRKFSTTGKKFTVIKHNNLKVIEVARIA